MRKVLTVFGWGGALVALLFAWAVLAPPQLLGSTTYLATRGVSMLPYLHMGDLVAVRAASSYQVGDVVAYRNPLLGNQIILHRVVGIDRDRYVMKGDNNSWLDEYRPLQSDVVGREWFHASGWGDFIGAMRAPENSAVLFGIAGLFVTGFPARISERLLGRRRRAKKGRPARTNASPGIGGGSALTGSAAVALAVLVLGLVASTALFVYAGRQPATNLRAVSVPYTQVGSYSWTGTAPKSDTYRDGTVGTGDTVFLKLTHKVQFGYTYVLTSQEPVVDYGTASMTAVVQSTLTSWKRSYMLAAPTSFVGGTVSETGALDLASVLGTAQSYLREVGLRSDDLTLTVIADVKVEGTIGGQAFRDEFTPKLPFHLDSSMLRFESTAQPTYGSSAAAGSISVGNPSSVAPAALGPQALLAPNTTGQVIRQLTVANMIGGLGLSFPASGVRMWSGIVAIVLALGAVASLVILVLALRGRDEPSRIERRYGSKLVPVGTIAALRSETAVEVTSMASLVRLAEHHDRMILHEEVAGLHSYAIQDGDLFYFYRAPSAQLQATPPSPALTV